LLAEGQLPLLYIIDTQPFYSGVIDIFSFEE